MYLFNDAFAAMFVRFRPDPHTCYALSFAIALVVYLLGWSELYPTLQPLLVLFLILTFIVHLWLSWKFRNRYVTAATIVGPAEGSPVYVTLFIYSLWLAEFAYEGGIPLFKIVFNIPYNYRLFGIPSLHVFVVTFSSFYTVYLFQLYLSRRTRLLLFLYIVNLAAAVLIYSRAMLFFNLTGSLIVYIVFKDGLFTRQIIGAVVVTVLLFYVFGVLGSLRVSRIAGEPYNNENFLGTGKATEAFRKSILPKEYFWAYIYISSPIANLQQNIDLSPPEPLTIGKIARLVNAEMLPDFLSKRINRLLDLNNPIDNRIPGPFNVSTIYSRSYSHAAWTGVLLMSAFLIAFPFFFVWILPSTSRFFLPGWAILCTMYLFSVYDNTFSFTGLSFQLTYPILFHWINQKFSRLARVF